jgi:hypothetical protein
LFRHQRIARLGLKMEMIDAQAGRFFGLCHHPITGRYLSDINSAVAECMVSRPCCTRRACRTGRHRATSTVNRGGASTNVSDLLPDCNGREV